jgi:hypothetical protein
MPSFSLNRWFTDRATLLDEIEKAHRFVRGSGPGVRTATQQINQAYVVLLSAQFQAFCRELHYECVDAIVKPLVSADYRLLVSYNLRLHLKLDRGNPNPGNIGSDFNRFKLSFWPLVDANHTKNLARKAALEELNEWRNAVAHHDYSPSMMLAGHLQLKLGHVRNWRASCDGLARSFVDVMQSHLRKILGYAPW